MTKTGSTKNKILNLVASGNKTLSDISRDLNLAPSTVSQHIQELREMGAIQEIDNPHIKKWKYYRLNPDFDYAGSGIGAGITQSKIKIPVKTFYYILGLALIGIAAYTAFSYHTTTSLSATTTTNFVPVSLTDPPSVPNGTSALVITYSSVGLHVANSVNGSGWVTSQTSGKVDLMSLLNVSQVIAGINLTSGAAIDSARFNISSANITINGTTYNVTVPNDQISTTLNGSNIYSNSSVLIDLSPTIVAIYTNDSTIFVMVPSVKAILVSGKKGSSGTIMIGQRLNLNGTENAILKGTESISITNATLMSTNNSLSIKLTVTNDGNKSVVLNNLLIIGNQTPVITYNNTCPAPAVLATSPIPLWCRILVSQNSTAKIQISDLPTLPGLQSQTTASASASASVSNAVGSIQNDFNVIHSEAANFTATVGNAIAEGANASAVVAVKLNQSIGTKSNLFVTNSSGLNAAGIGVIIPGNNSYKITTAGANASSLIPSNLPVKVDVKLGLEPNAIINAPSNFTINGTLLYKLIEPQIVNSKLYTSGKVATINLQDRALDFLIQQNGTLTLTDQVYSNATTGKHKIYQQYGYTLNPGESANFTFNAPVSLANNFQIVLIPGEEYKMAVFGNSGSYTYTTVTAR